MWLSTWQKLIILSIFLIENAILMSILWINFYFPPFKMTWKESYSKVFRVSLLWPLLSFLYRYCTVVNCSVIYNIILLIPFHLGYNWPGMLLYDKVEHIVDGRYSTIHVHFFLYLHTDRLKSFCRKKLHSEYEFKRIACLVLISAQSMFCWIFAGD